MIYLASPYSHPSTLVREFRFRAACDAAAELIFSGRLVFSPVAHSHHIVIAGRLPTEWGFWQRHCRQMIASCNELAVLTLDGWKESAGVTAEIAIANELGKTVWYTPPY